MCRYAWTFHGTCYHTVVGAVVECCEKAVAPAAAFPRRLRRTTSLPDFHNIPPQQEMPALPLFPPGGFRQWMAGPSTQDATSTAQSSQSLRHREEGIRGTDESGTLHHNEAVLQHLTQSSRSPDDHHVGTDGRRMTSHGSMTVASETEGPPKPAETDALKVEVNKIQADQEHMEAQADRRHNRSFHPTTRQQRSSALRAASSKIPGLAALRLTTTTTEDVSETRADDGSSASQSKTSKLPDTTKRSYVRTGTSKITRAVDSTISPASENSPQQSSSPSSPQSDRKAASYDAVEYLQETTDPERSSPHFAQPTQAATRRVDQTLRRDTQPAKVSPEASPGKSIKAKAPSFETEKRAVQRSQKRNSLPEGWMSDRDHASAAERKDQTTPGSTASATPKDQSPAGPVLRKKTSSYMSPTKSAQQRSIATIGGERQSRKLPRVKARPTEINTNLANKDVLPSSASSPASVFYDNDSDVFFSPKSHFSSPLRKERSSPLERKAPEGIASAVPERPISAIVLPMPLPQVANTTVTHRDSEESLLGLIHEKLEREDLLRRDTAQKSTPIPDRTRSNTMSGPLGSRFGTAATAIGKPTRRQPRRSNEESDNLSHPRTRNPDNEPMSSVISGLRGQSSTEIGKALADEQQRLSMTEILADVAKDCDRQAYNDPAIIYRGRKPASNGKPHEPGFMLDSKSFDPDALAIYEARQNASRPSSLRATATKFVPYSGPETMTKIEQCLRPPDASESHWNPRSLGLVDSNMHQDSGAGSIFDSGFQPENPGQTLYSTWHGADAPSLYEEHAQQPAYHTVLGQADLIHGDYPFDTPAIAPTSTDISPSSLFSSSPSSQRCKRNLAQWEISSKGRRKYHWSGGDGLEISFRGVGPDAEHDPNSPVLYRNYRANTKTFHLQAGTYPKTNVPGSPLPPNAPKLMRDYAEKMALSCIPCMDDTWTGEHDSMPAVVPVAGLCGPCKAGDNALHRIGGGINLVSWSSPV